MAAYLPASRKRWLRTAMRFSRASFRISTTPTYKLGKRGQRSKPSSASWNVAATASATATPGVRPQPGTRTSAKDLARIDVPTLVMHGTLTAFFQSRLRDSAPPSSSKERALLVVKDGPHCILGTHAEEVNAELLSFLGGKAGKSQTEAA